jgi:predicted ATP-grasp superfamily ATP-dependent carboligase
MALAVIRELGEHGVPVHAVARSPRALGLYSRWVAGGYVRPSSDQDTIGQLNEIARTHGAPFLLGISETDLLLIRSAADSGELSGIDALVPGAAQLAVVQDKMATYAVAERVGLPVPVTWQPRPGPEPPRLPDHLELPCILKWSSLQQKALHQGIPKLRAQYCYTRDDLTRALMQYAALGCYPMVQSFCPGHGLGHMIFLHRGEPLLRFQHRRISEWPPEGGSSTVCESLPLSVNAELFDRSVALLQSFGWEGPAMVEYRFDLESNDAKLMEVNGRFWGSLPLAFHAGSPFAWFTYAVLGLGRRLETPVYKVGLRCRYMIPETKRLVSLLRNRGRTQNRELSFNLAVELREYLLQFLSLRTRYFVFSFRDPRPFFADMAFAAHKGLRSLLQKAER